jgi:hypothetical protein
MLYLLVIWILNLLVCVSHSIDSGLHYFTIIVQAIFGLDGGGSHLLKRAPATGYLLLVGRIDLFGHHCVTPG